MALTYTPKLSSQKMPSFRASTVTGETWTSDALLSAPAKVIVFICNHCPYVKAIESRLIRLARALQAQSVPLIGICSNDPEEYPEDQPQELLKRWREQEYGFTYLVDTDQSIAKAFGAVCTPDFFVYDKDDQLAYRGRLDDSWKDESKVTREELKQAVEAVLQGRKIAEPQSPSMGCSIKWKDTARSNNV
jgi:hypothetical protein